MHTEQTNRSDKKASYWKDVARQFFKNKIAVLGLYPVSYCGALRLRPPVYQLRSRQRYGTL